MNSIDKHDFLPIYPFARNATFKASNIQNSFRGAGLVPLDANHVLEKLNICVESVNSLSSDHPYGLLLLVVLAIWILLGPLKNSKN